MMLKRKLIGVTLAAALFGVAGPVAAEVVRAGEGGFLSRHEVVVYATPKEVWLALISPADWWRSEHTWSGESKNLSLMPKAGGCFCEIIPEVDEPGRFTLEGSVEHMRVIQAYPEQALRLVGALGPLQSEPVTGVLTIAISKTPKGTRIVWEYNVGGQMRYEVPVISKAVDGVMGAQLSALAKKLRIVEVPAPPPPLQPSQPPAAVKPGEAGQGGTGVRPAMPSAAAPLAKPAASPAAKPAAAPPAVSPTSAPPAPKPAAKTPTVKDVFGDLEG